jgi:hypothetical protein
MKKRLASLWTSFVFLSGCVPSSDRIDSLLQLRTTPEDQPILIERIDAEWNALESFASLTAEGENHQIFKLFFRKPRAGDTIFNLTRENIYFSEDDAFDTQEITGGWIAITAADVQSVSGTFAVEVKDRGEQRKLKGTFRIWRSL